MNSGSSPRLRIKLDRALTNAEASEASAAEAEEAGEVERAGGCHKSPKRGVRAQQAEVLPREPERKGVQVVCSANRGRGIEALARRRSGGGAGPPRTSKAPECIEAIRSCVAAMRKAPTEAQRQTRPRGSCEQRWSKTPQM